MPSGFEDSGFPVINMTCAQHDMDQEHKLFVKGEVCKLKKGEKDKPALIQVSSVI